MTVIDDFREAAVPRLKAAAKVQALFVALALASLSEARSEIAALARMLGSGLLPRRDQDRLFDAWIPETLWDEVDRAHDRVAAIESRMDAAIKDNPSRFYEGLACRCDEPERMRWTFAAISKPYRVHLIQERRHARKA